MQTRHKYRSSLLLPIVHSSSDDYPNNSLFDFLGFAFFSFYLCIDSVFLKGQTKAIIDHIIGQSASNSQTGQTTVADDSTGQFGKILVGKILGSHPMVDDKTEHFSGMSPIPNSGKTSNGISLSQHNIKC